MDFEEGVKQKFLRKIDELEYEYTFDRQELGKIVFITSAALLVVSVNTALTLESVSSDLKQTNNDVEQASSVITSDNFQNALDTLQRVQSSRLTQQLEVARNSFQEAQSSFENIETAQNRVDRTYRRYQWMSLISILGLVTGVALRFG